MKNEKNTYTLEQRMYDEEFFPKFAFNAKDETEALSKARGWAHYHGMINEDVRVREATENEAQNWMHNEWVEGR